jgi:hypothetical protein
MLNMKTLTPGLKAFRKLFLRSTLGLLSAGMLMISCTDDIIHDNPLPTSGPERIDLAIEGGMEMVIHRIQDDGLIHTYSNPDPFYNENETVIRMALDDDNSLELALYNAALEDPLSELLSYSVYPVQDMEDKNIYLVANCVDSEGIVRFSSSMTGMPPVIQVNAFEIRAASDEGFNVRIRELELFTTSPENRSSSILINGTFIAQR